MKYFVFIIIFILSIMSGSARVVYIKGQVIDSSTNQELPGAEIKVISPTDSIIRSLKALKRRSIDGVIFQSSEFGFPYTYADSVQENILRLTVTYPNFDTSHIEIPLHIGRREREKQIAPIAMTRAAKRLDEVTVTASKVKFYYRGDTLVYNADAFMLAEGSMLDALIEQLPGVELKSNGEIIVNGKKVDNLLLNGKDFFSSDRKLLLDNLGAYTVKNINVYDKWGQNSEFVGRNIGNDSEYVMDVRLKKEYSRGTIVNIEAGGGTSSRWLGRLFAMHFGSRDRYTLYANANNLNDNRRPGKSDSWSRGAVQPGEYNRQKAGFEYAIEATDKRWNIKGSVEGQNERSNLSKEIFSQNFLPNGDTYEHNSNATKSRNWSVTTGHELYNQWRLANLRIRPAFSYTKASSHNRATLLSSADKSFDAIINESLWDTESRNHSMNASLDLSSIIKFNSMPDYVELTGGVQYRTDWAEKDRRYSIDYSMQDKSESQHQRYRNHPNHDLSTVLAAKYDYQWSSTISSSLKYGMTYQHVQQTSDMFIVERIAEVTANEHLMTLYHERPDYNNSYNSRKSEIGYVVTPAFLLNNSAFWVQFNMPIELRHQQLHYVRGGQVHDVNRNSIVLTTSDTFLQWHNPDNTFRLSFYYHLNTQLPSLTSLIDITDDTDPLNIMEGNGNLKNAYDNSFELNLNFGPRRSHGLSLSGGIVTNSLVNGYTYDPQSGIRRFKTYNVNGDWQLGAALIDDIDFGHNKNMSLRFNTGVTYHNAVDMIGESGLKPCRGDIHNTHISETIDYDWKFNRHKIGAKVSGVWRHTTFPKNNAYNDINAANISYGVTGLFRLPANFEISTDIGANSRFGYNQQIVNRTELLWNMRISCSLAKGKWLIALDGYDLLNQLRNVTYNVNPQGRVEIRTNTVPRYALLHVQYKLNILPRKRK